MDKRDHELIRLAALYAGDCDGTCDKYDLNRILVKRRRVNSGKEAIPKDMTICNLFDLIRDNIK